MYINQRLFMFFEVLFIINILLLLFSYFSMKSFKKRKEEIKEMSFLVAKQKDDAEKRLDLEKEKFKKQCEDERRKIQLERGEMQNHIKEEKNKLYNMRLDFIKELEEKDDTKNKTDKEIAIDSLFEIRKMRHDLKSYRDEINLVNSNVLLKINNVESKVSDFRKSTDEKFSKLDHKIEDEIIDDMITENQIKSLLSDIDTVDYSDVCRAVSSELDDADIVSSINDAKDEILSHLNG